MSKLFSKKYLGITVSIIFCFSVVFLIYFRTYMLYPTIALQTIVFQELITLNLLFLAGINIHRSRAKIKDTTNLVKFIWYRDHNVILALAWLAGFMIFVSYNFTQDEKFVMLKASIVALFFVTAILLFFYALILYIKNK